MDVAVDPNLAAFNFRQIREHLLRVKYFWLKLYFRGDPLAVEVKTGGTVSIVATDNAIWVQARYQNERVEFAKEARFFAV